MIWPSTKPRLDMNLPTVLVVPADSSTFAAGRLRRHCATSGPVPEPQPAATAKAMPVASAAAFVGSVKGRQELSQILRWNRPAASGERMWRLVSTAPAD